MRSDLAVAVLTVTGCLLLPGCQGRDSGPSGIVVSDSAGVEQVFVDQAASDTVPTLLVTEELRIGSVDGSAESQFFAVVGVAENRNGDLFVLDVGNRVIRAFDRDGTFLREIGGEGGGPGRFEGPYALGLVRDSIVVLDRRLVHVFSGDGALLDAHQHSLPGRQMPWTVTGYSEGWMAGIRRPPDRSTSPPGGPFVDMFWLAQFDPKDGSVGPALHEIGVRTTYQIGSGVVSPLFAAEGQYAINELGEIFSSAGGEYVVDKRNAQGELIRRLKVETARVRVTDADLDRFMVLELADSGSRGGEQGQFAQDFERGFPQLPRPEFRPVVGRILASQARILVERLDLDPDPFEEGDPSSWDMFGSDGRALGRFQLPPNIRLLLLTDSAFFGIVRDELGVEFVARFRIES